MSAIVQATCPGCKNVLRIPADWVSQPIRCKHCGVVMLSKNQQGIQDPGKQPAPKPKTPPAQPVATALKPASAKVNGSPFADLAAHAEDGDAAKAPRQPVRKAGGWGKGAVIAGTVVVLAFMILCGVVFGLGLASLSKLLPASHPAVVNRDKEEGPPDKDAGATDGRHETYKDKNADTNKDKPVKQGLVFPRRALVISLHGYLYADTVHPGTQVEGSHNVMTLKNRLNTGLRIPLTQIGYLSDVGPRGQAHSPTKSVIQETLVKFLESSRAQDRILVFFIGHAVEIGDDAYLVPIEGELDSPTSLIPLKWVYKELADCKARQKVLVLDVCRSNPTRGAERPGTGPMGPKLNAMLTTPPDGVQVWSTCSADQFSFETEASPMGVFLDKMLTLLESEGGVNKLTGKIQKEENSLPIETLNDAIAKSMKTDLTPLKLTQVPHVAGKEPAEGAAFNKDEPLPPTPAIANATGSKDNAEIIKKVLEEISLPPIKPGVGGDYSIKVEMLPAFDTKAMANYAAADSKLRAPINKVRATLWAYSALPEPPALKKDVTDLRAEFGNISMKMLKDSYAYPPNENNFKKAIGDEEFEVAKMLGNLIRLRKEFIESDGAGKDRKEEPSKRWQVNYDYVQAHLEAQIAYLYEYQAMLGGLRKELPPKEPGTNRWHMVAVSAPSLDSDGKKMAKSCWNIFDTLTAEHANTPWFVLAKRERMISLGLDWKSVK